MSIVFLFILYSNSICFDKYSVTIIGVQSVTTLFSSLPITGMDNNLTCVSKYLSPSSMTNIFPFIFEAKFFILSFGKGYVIPSDRIDGFLRIFFNASRTIISLSPLRIIPQSSSPNSSFINSEFSSHC